MEKENKKTNNKNVMKTIKICTIVLLIILVSMISFFGIYSQNKNQMSNKVKDYSYAMDINGARNIKLKVNEKTKDIIKDSDGNVIESATDEEIAEKGYVKETVPNNSEDVLTEENYNKSKKILEKRLKNSGIEDYNISLNKQTGEMNIEIPENSNTDSVVSNLNTMGKFEIIDTETKEVLLDNSYIKSSDIMYNTASSGTTTYLEIAFNKEGKEKLEEITKTYVTTSNENTTVEGNETENNENSDEATTENNTTEESTDTAEQSTESKKITMKIDDEEILSTSFEEPITTGKIQLSVGSATTDSSTLQDYISQARNVATVLDSGNLPIKYDLDKNEYILSDIEKQDLVNIEITIAIIAIIGIIVLIVKYKTNGLLAGFAYLGLAALYMITARYTNVTISIESIFGIVTMLILNYIFTIMLLDNIVKISKDKQENIVNKATLETYTKFFVRIIPICIMVIAFCFVKWIPISSFGMITFWRLIIIAVYNAIITRLLLKIKTEGK